MNTSAKELYDAIAQLSNNYKGNTNTFLEQANKFSIDIGNHLEGVNNSLSDGWHTTASLFGKLNGCINDDLASLAQFMSQFSSDTIEDEMKAVEANETANDTADDILDKLSKYAAKRLN